MEEKITALTKTLMLIPSVSGTAGERDIADYIERWFRRLPYFASRPEQVIVQELRDDPLGRRNVFALIRGEGGEGSGNPRTIIFHGHFDTVGVEDFGEFEQSAFDADALAAIFRDADIGEEAKADLLSGDYLFGRGSVDMKSGDAVFMCIAEYLSDHIETFSGNVLFLFNSQEETTNAGMIEAADEFKRLAEQWRLKYLLAVNDDYTSPAYPGDKSRYVYTGTVGKLLPCFYVQGKETHVGEPFAGFDASFLAGELVRRIHLNSDLCDCYENDGENSYTQPPVALKCRDLKTHYDVQTAGGAFVYFNYLLYTSTVPQVTKKLTEIARAVAVAAAAAIDKKRRAYGTLTGTTPTGIADMPEALAYGELVSRADAKLGAAFAEKRRHFAKSLRAAGVDEREAALETVRFICAEAGFKQPLIVLFYAAPYCPHHTLKSAAPEEKALLDSLRVLLSEFSAETGEKITVLPFFPCISDASYIKVDDDDESLRFLRANFPEYNTFFPVDFAKIKALNIPGINCGALGKDAHKWTERVYTPYTFKVLPRLLLKLVQAQLG